VWKITSIEGIDGRKMSVEIGPIIVRNASNRMNAVESVDSRMGGDAGGRERSTLTP
jgi:hypothetical protein